MEAAFFKVAFFVYKFLLLAFKIKKGELPRLECFHNGIILIVNCFSKLLIQI